LTVTWDPNKKIISDAYKTYSVISSTSMNAQDELAMHNFY